MNEELFHLGVKALIRNSEGKFLLLKVNPAKLTKVPGWDGWSREAYWDIPGGRMKRDATVEETLRNEVEEETGITSIAALMPLMMVLSPIRIPWGDYHVGLILSIYEVEVGDTSILRLSDEHIEAKWALPQEASALLAFKYPKEFTEKIAQL